MLAVGGARPCAGYNGSSSGSPPMPTLLVLDNCEHIVDAVSEVTSRLLDFTSQLRIIATSQLPLGLDGRPPSPLEPLPVRESIELFTSRAAQIRKKFVLDAEPLQSLKKCVYPSTDCR